VRLEKKYSDSETSSEESDSTSDAGVTAWVKEDTTQNLGPFTGNPFLETSFKCYGRKLNRYYFQNQGKYASSSKRLKWVDVCVVCAADMKRSETRYICEFCVVPLHKGK
jgi:hypothetical protein